MAERRRGRQTVAKIARNSARREEMRDNGVWTYFDQAVSVNGSSSQPRVVAVTISPVPTQPVTLYGMHLAATVSIADTSTSTVPWRGVIAITRLSAAENVADATSPGIVANPAREADANDRPWRYWMPFLLQGQVTSGQPWAIAPIRLPLRGMHKLDEGQRLAILLASPPGNSQVRAVQLTVWGRFRYLVHRTS